MGIARARTHGTRARTVQAAAAAGTLIYQVAEELLRMAASLVSTASKKGGVGSLDKAAMLGFDLSVCELQASQVAE